MEASVRLLVRLSLRETKNVSTSHRVAALRHFDRLASGWGGLRGSINPRRAMHGPQPFFSIDVHPEAAKAILAQQQHLVPYTALPSIANRPGTNYLTGLDDCRAAAPTDNLEYNPLQATVEKAAAMDKQAEHELAIDVRPALNRIVARREAPPGWQVKALWKKALSLRPVSRCQLLVSADSSLQRR